MKAASLSRAGSALVITLLVLVLLAVAVLAFFVKSQSSMQTSRSQTEAFSADQYALDGLNHATGLLRYATGSTNTQWASQPGRITRIGTSSNEIVNLHSGLASMSINGVNLNSPLVQNPSEGVVSYDASQKMPLSWINIREDGSRTVSDSYDATNRVVGRYAFWVDDNSSRVNINTAWTKDSVNTNSVSHPSRVSLQRAFPRFSSADVETVSNWRASQRFNSPMDILRAFGSNAASYSGAVREAGFWTTHASSSPRAETTYWGAPKIVLTTKAEWAKDDGGNQRPYLDISDYGVTSLKYKETVEMLKEYLSRTDWPGFAQKSFQQKYYGDDALLLEQAAVNIIEYVRARESSDTLMKPARKRMGTTNFTAQGATRRFRLVEAGFWRNQANPTSGAIYFVLHLPKNGGLTEYTMTGWRFQIIRGLLKDDLNIPPIDFSQGKYVLISRPCTVPVTGAIYDCCLKFFDASGEMFDTYPTSASASNSNRIAFPVTTLPVVAGSNPDITQIQTIHTYDPFVAEAGDWSAPDANRFANLNIEATMRQSMGLGNPPSDFSKGQDLDASGNLTDEGCIIPPPSGTEGNTAGRVESLAELGHVQMGTTSPGIASAPFRTLRFQPRHPSATAHLDGLPDWLLLDLFALPKMPGASGPETLISQTGDPGKVNVNNTIEPFSDLKRTQALEALFDGIFAFGDESTRELMMTNIIKRTPSNSSLAKGILNGAEPYRSVGELVEIKGVADAGEASEKRLNEIIDLVSTQGNIFSVYVVGESVVQKSDGTIVPRAEARRLFMVARRTDNDGDYFEVILNKPLNL